MTSTNLFDIPEIEDEGIITPAISPGTNHLTLPDTIEEEHQDGDDETAVNTPNAVTPYHSYPNLHQTLDDSNEFIPSNTTSSSYPRHNVSGGPIYSSGTPLTHFDSCPIPHRYQHQSHPPPSQHLPSDPSSTGPGPYLFLTSSRTNYTNYTNGSELERGLSRKLSRIRSIKSTNEQATEEESALKNDIKLKGEYKEEKGVLEKVEWVDFGDGDGKKEVLVVEWAAGDPENPFNWSTKRKIAILFTITYLSMCTAINCTSVAPMTAGGGPEHFGVTREKYVLSLTVFLLSISFAPMILAPLSESFGRNGIYTVTTILSTLLFLPQIFSNNFAVLITSRVLQGITSSVGNSMVGGSVADIFLAKERGRAMNVFAFMIFIGQAMGGVIFGWVAQDLGIPWCYGIQALLGVVSCFLNALFLRETRGDVLLSRRAKKLTKKSEKLHLCVADLHRSSFLKLMKVSLVRPFQYLLTEPIVAALSLWIGSAWGIVFLAGTSVHLVFEQYGWSEGQLGTVQITILIGAILGTILNIHQEKLYNNAAKRNLKLNGKKKAPPEARLYYAAYGGLLFPICMYIFAWTGTGPQSGIPWIVPALVLCLMFAGIYSMYLGVFNYLVDAYETYSSSAQAAQSFSRNVLSACFPLFAKQMFVNLGYPQASTILASISLILSAAPILLIRYGSRLRAQSRVASALEN